VLQDETESKKLRRPAARARSPPIATSPGVTVSGEKTVRERATRRIRFLVGAVVCVVLPVLSKLDGSSRFAWSMYARASEFRIDLVALDGDGNAKRRNPTALAEHAATSVASLLAGSDHWRQGPSMATLRAHLDDLAAYACRETGAAAVEVAMHERVVDQSERVTTRRRACSP
jgi:hypothetical protein